ncbi:MAG: hypothetical protein ACI9FR_002425 [Cryomorphaceae bacterium]|jgi:hypothetical protein
MATAYKQRGSTLLITNIILTIVIVVICWFLFVNSQKENNSISTDGLSQEELKDIADLQTQLALEKAKLEQLAEQRKTQQLAKELVEEKANKLLQAQSDTVAGELSMQLKADKKRITNMIAIELQTTKENADLLEELALTRGQNQTLNQQIVELMGQMMEVDSIASTDASTSSQSQENLDLLKALEGDLSAFTSPETQQQALLIAQQQEENANNLLEVEEGDKIPSSAYQLQAEIDNLNTAAIEDADNADKIPSAVYQLQAAVSDIMEVDNSSNNVVTLSGLVDDDDDESIKYLKALEEEAEVRQNEMRLITVVEGVTLSKVAARAYGDALLYHKTFDANPTVVSDANIITPGMRLRVPL